MAITNEQDSVEKLIVDICPNFVPTGIQSKFGNEAIFHCNRWTRQPAVITVADIDSNRGYIKCTGSPCSFCRNGL